MYVLAVELIAKALVDLADGFCLVSSVAGGAGIALSYVISEQLDMSYYGQALTPGLLVITIHLPQQDRTFTETIPFYHQFKQEGQETYNSRDYCPPQLILQFSFLLIVFSLLLKIMLAAYKKWHEHAGDRCLFKQEYKIEQLQQPGFKEYQMVCLKEALDSVSSAAFGCALVGGVFSLSSLSHFSKNITRPLTGASIADSKYYHGPLTSDIIPVDMSLKYNATLELSHLHAQIIIQETAQTKTVANVTYGGGLFFKAKNNTAFPVVLPAMIMVGSCAASGFLAKKLTKARDDRLFEARESAYTLM